MRFGLGPPNGGIDVLLPLGLAELLPTSLARSIVANSGVNGAFKGDKSGCVFLDVVGGGSVPPSSMAEIDIEVVRGGGSSRAGAGPSPWL